MRIRVVHGIDELASDLRKITMSAPRRMKQVVKTNTREGRDQARVFARESAGAHGKHYPRSITDETSSFAGFGAASFQGEYGPDPGLPQGGMSFEHGSRNQKPHLDLARSADIIGPQFADDVADLADDLFWPHG